MFGVDKHKRRRIFSTFETGMRAAARVLISKRGGSSSLSDSPSPFLEGTLSFISFIRIWEAGGKNKTNMLVLARSNWSWGRGIHVTSLTRPKEYLSLVI